MRRYCARRAYVLAKPLRAFVTVNSRSAPDFTMVPLRRSRVQRHSRGGESSGPSPFAALAISISCSSPGLLPWASRPGGSSTTAADPASCAEVERALHGSGFALVDERLKGEAPVLQGERVGEQPGEVDAAGHHEVEVVLERVLADAVDLLDAGQRAALEDWALAGRRMRSQTMPLAVLVSRSLPQRRSRLTR